MNDSLYRNAVRVLALLAFQFAQIAPLWAAQAPLPGHCLSCGQCVGGAGSSVAVVPPELEAALKEMSGNALGVELLIPSAESVDDFAQKEKVKVALPSSGFASAHLAYAVGITEYNTMRDSAIDLVGCKSEILRFAELIADLEGGSYNREGNQSVVQRFSKEFDNPDPRFGVQFEFGGFHRVRLMMIEEDPVATSGDGHPFYRVRFASGSTMDLRPFLVSLLQSQSRGHP